MEAYLDGLCGDGSRRVWFTGHSLGGALATLAAGRYERAPEVYTFGAPRVGDGEHVKSLDTPVYRFVNGGTRCRSSRCGDHTGTPASRST